MSFLVPDTSAQLTNMLAKRDSITQKIIELGSSAISQNENKIASYKQSVLDLVRENTEIEVVLADL